ncbi:MAG TPA: glycosyltransferase [Candidatus Egerieimonas intestinavium]|uniref:Glycosyltransferase n=1 Tax=Candidatus Egerieimonas intestinavium TaxID=2840777 RepID=A0A9D1EKK8_9FIRM|nr:glycosyltransferase [Candidatus Egerieimonas intestinavium]
MSEIKVSVIIPVYQVEAYLERAVDSALAQTLEEKEIILVDDGSPDGSPEICDRYARQYPQLIRVIHKENEGLGLARNAGAQAARGEYLAFLDSDDTVEPQMYQEMYEKAREGDYDIVMCDVNILYVEEDRSVISVSYPREEIDPGDYIARGNNITYSVNKLFKRAIWQENRYQRMLFEDIALIPALVSRYPHMGYVKKPFYNYYRRSNTISTSQVGAMVDIVKAYREFLEECSPDFREEAVYCAARQILWNMTDSRRLFQADFVDFLQEYKRYFLMNPYLKKDKKTGKLLDFLDREVIPDTFICVHILREIPQGYRDSLREHFPQSRLLEAGEEILKTLPLPPSVQEAVERGNFSYAEEYAALYLLKQEGGLVVFPEYRVKLPLKALRMNRVFFGFEDQESVSAGCFGALREHYVIQALLDTYWEKNIFNQALLPLGERIRDFLMVHFGLQANGRNQLLQKEVQVYLPSILSYDMQDGENCCSYAGYPVPRGYQLVSDGALRLWSERLMENWNLYKRERDSRGPAGKQSLQEPVSGGSLREQQIEERARQVAELYESSTCWKITRPLRALGKWLGR